MILHWNEVREMRMRRHVTTLCWLLNSLFIAYERMIIWKWLKSVKAYCANTVFDFENDFQSGCWISFIFLYFLHINNDIKWIKYKYLFVFESWILSQLQNQVFFILATKIVCIFATQYNWKHTHHIHICIFQARAKIIIRTSNVKATTASRVATKVKIAAAIDCCATIDVICYVVAFFTYTHTHMCTCAYTMCFAKVYK